MKIIRFCLFFSIFSYSLSGFANAIIETAPSFSMVQELILNDKDPQHTLLVMDDDDTLTMMPCPSQSNCQYLGGPAWFSWQESLPANDSNRVYSSFAQLLNISNLLVAMSSDAPVVESDIPAILKTAQQLKMPMLVETARNYETIPATETEFSNDGILNIIENTALKTPSNNISFPGYYIPEGATRPVAYENGILYCAGQNKGLMLQDFLNRIKQVDNIHEIIFVDDTQKNVTDVASAYESDTAINVIGVYYTYLEAQKNAFTIGPDAKKLQATANAEWHTVDAALKKNLLSLSL